MSNLAHLTDDQLRGNIAVWKRMLSRGLKSTDDALDLINAWKRELAERAAGARSMKPSPAEENTTTKL